MAQSTQTIRAEPKVSLKLLIDTNGKRVVFAEADKDFVDFLFHILSLPMATAIGLVKRHQMNTMGSLANLYGSIDNLNDYYMKPNLSKDAILKPKPSYFLPRPSLALDGAPTVNKFYGCSSIFCSVEYFSDEQGLSCPLCMRKMTAIRKYVAPNAPKQASGGDQGGFVRGIATYIVTDDLVVKPMSTMEILTLLFLFNVKELNDLEEKVVDLGMDEALKLLNASWQSKKVLTEVFLKGTTTGTSHPQGYHRHQT